MRAMSLVSEEAENDHNELRMLQMSLESTNTLVETLCQQLSDLKDQVSQFIVADPFFFKVYI